MNATSLEGQGQDIGGNVKEAVGKVTGDRSLQGEGVADQITGNAKQAAGAAKDAASKAKAFAKVRPWTAAAVIGVVGLAVLNTLRGK